MKLNKLLTVFLLTIITQAVFAQFPDGVNVIDAKPNTVTTFTVNLSDGKFLTDLSWASSSSVACFPATQNHKFTGNHIIYITEIPPHSKMDITVIPDDKTKNMSIYAYTVGLNNNATVPNLTSCVTCEADHNRDYKKVGRTQDHTRTVHLNAINNPYKVVIGVAGADGLTEGSFILKIKNE